MSTLINNKYPKLETEKWEKQLNECCEQGISIGHQGSDCCYDDWRKKLRLVVLQYDCVYEKANLIEKRLAVVTDKRDRLKLWIDELMMADDLTHHICAKLDQLINHIADISTCTDMTVNSINIVFCMIKDFYFQIDEIKVRYDYIMNCIKCIEDPVFEVGEGILKCLEDYYQKLDEVIKTRDSLIALVILAIKLSNQLNQNLKPDYGLAYTIKSWKSIFICKEGHEDEGKLNKRQKTIRPQSKDINNDCAIIPRLKMPICDDEYYDELEKLHSKYKGKVKRLSYEMTKINKKKERLQACKLSLENAIVEVDPKLRCN